MNMVELIQQISKNQLDTEKPMQLMFGTVVSDGEPLRVRLSEKVILEESMLIRISRCRYERGTHLILLRDHGGQRWYVLEVPGHNELSGLDGEDCHPIPAITGLRGELDDHDGRLKQLETVRVPALEHDMNDSDGKVPLLTGRVSALETGKSDKGHTHSMHEVSGLDSLAGKVDDIIAQGGEPNVIETVRQNGTALPVTGKAVDVTVPTKVSDLTNDSGYQTVQQVQAAVGSGLASLFEADTYGPAAAVSFEAEHGGLPLKSCTARIVAVQAGSGEPSPSNIRAISGWTGTKLSHCGGNLVPDSWYSTSLSNSGVTGAKEGDSFVLNGVSTSSSGINWYIKRYDTASEFSLPAGTYTLSGISGPLADNAPMLALYKRANGSNVQIGYCQQKAGFTSRTFTLTEYTEHLFLVIVVRAGSDVTGYTIKPMLEPGEDASEFSPYGSWNAINVPFPSAAGTVYGGTIDVTAGVLTVIYGSADIGDLNWARSTSYTNPVFHVAVPGRKAGSNQVLFPVYAVTDRSLNTMPDYTCRPHGTSSRLYIRDDRYATVDAFIAAMSGVIFVFELETPVSYQLSPQVIKSLAGVNNIWADCGNVAVEYGAFLQALQQEIEALKNTSGQ